MTKFCPAIERGLKWLMWIVYGFSSFKLVIFSLQPGAVGSYSVWGPWFSSQVICRWRKKDHIQTWWVVIGGLWYSEYNTSRELYNIVSRDFMILYGVQGGIITAAYNYSTIHVWQSCASISEAKEKPAKQFRAWIVSKQTYMYEDLLWTWTPLTCISL
jgi:hypothetical protein